MRRQPQDLINTAQVEAWPGGLLRAHDRHQARTLARAGRVLRRKRDGRYLAAELPGIRVITHLEPIEDPVSFEDTRLERK